MLLVVHTSAEKTKATTVKERDFSVTTFLSIYLSTCASTREHHNDGNTSNMNSISTILINYLTFLPQ